MHLVVTFKGKASLLVAAKGREVTVGFSTIFEVRAYLSSFDVIKLFLLTKLNCCLT